MSSRVLSYVGLVVGAGLIAGAVVWWQLSPKPVPKPVLSYIPNPVTVKAQPDAEHSASAVIGPKGGVVKATAADGAEYALTIPAGALLSEQTISLTPVKSVESFPFSAGVTAGVQMVPEGLHLSIPATLTMTSSKIQSSPAMIGFAYNQDSGELSLHPQKSSGKTVSMEISTLSNVGATAATASEIQAQAGREPSDPQARTEQRLSVAATSGVVSSDVQVAALRDWYHDSVEYKLKVAEQDPSKIQEAIQEYSVWFKKTGEIEQTQEVMQMVVDGQKQFISTLNAHVSSLSASQKVSFIDSLVSVAQASGSPDLIEIMDTQRAGRDVFIISQQVLVRIQTWVNVSGSSPNPQIASIIQDLQDDYEDLMHILSNYSGYLTFRFSGDSTMDTKMLVKDICPVEGCLFHSYVKTVQPVPINVLPDFTQFVGEGFFFYDDFSVQPKNIQTPMGACSLVTSKHDVKVRIKNIEWEDVADQVKLSVDFFDPREEVALDCSSLIITGTNTNFDGKKFSDVMDAARAMAQSTGQFFAYDLNNIKVSNWRFFSNSADIVSLFGNNPPQFVDQIASMAQSLYLKNWYAFASIIHAQAPFLETRSAIGGPKLELGVRQWIDAGSAPYLLSKYYIKTYADGEGLTATEHTNFLIEHTANPRGARRQTPPTIIPIQPPPQPPILPPLPPIINPPVVPRPVPLFCLPFPGLPLTANDPDNDCWPSSQDNCPNTWNYDQIDSDGNGVGDDCQNFTASLPPSTPTSSTPTSTSNPRPGENPVDPGPSGGSPTAGGGVPNIPGFPTNIPGFPTMDFTLPEGTSFDPSQIPDLSAVLPGFQGGVGSIPGIDTTPNLESPDDLSQPNATPDDTSVPNHIDVNIPGETPVSVDINIPQLPPEEPSCPFGSAGDADGDCVLTYMDNCPNVTNADQADRDNDGIGDVCDACPNVDDATLPDRNGDGVADSCQVVVDEPPVDEPPVEEQGGLPDLGLVSAWVDTANQTIYFTLVNNGEGVLSAGTRVGLFVQKAGSSRNVSGQLYSEELYYELRAPMAVGEVQTFSKTYSDTSCSDDDTCLHNVTFLTLWLDPVSDELPQGLVAETNEDNNSCWLAGTEQTAAYRNDHCDTNPEL